ncbi:MAG: ABC transporter ATP-binding protein [Clostridiales bacterium]|jgi:iron complex transport system ATP-binding protein|nr:ABC transporter ATP-binding protein [Clostridiales bacterium]
MIEISKLSFGYKGYMSNKILNEINMTAYPGEITAIIGANGIGKSTILKNICGLLKGSGDIKICGKNINDYSRKELASHISYLSQDTFSSALLSVFEVVLLGRVARLANNVSDDELVLVRDVLCRLNLEKYASRNIGELSGGQRQLVFIAQALLKNPKVLIMDEPTSNLDLYYQFQIMNLLKELTVTEQFTTLVSLHQLDLVARFTDKVIVLNDGCVYDYGMPEKILTAKTFRDVYRMNTEIVNKCGAAYVIPISQYKDL